MARRDEVACEPVPGVASRLKCRGQVIESTGKVTYEVSIKELGYRPEPYAIADALMLADGKPIVEITDMALRLTGLTREALRRLWAAAHGAGGDPARAVVSIATASWRSRSASRRRRSASHTGCSTRSG